MQFLFAFFLSLILVLFPFYKSANAVLPSVKDNNNNNNQQIDKKLKEEISIEDLLGPKDIFPFLPDNHRDSGTGKFNTFN